MEETSQLKKEKGIEDCELATSIAAQEDLLQSKKTLSIERNFAKFANFIFSPSHSKVAPTARVKMWRTTDPDTGNQVLARIMIEPVARQTLTTLDLRVFLALQKIWWENPTDLQNVTRFRLRMLARVMKLGWGLQTFLTLKTSLLRLRKIPITWQFSFYNPETRRPIKFEEPINILAKLQLWTAEEKTARLNDVPGDNKGNRAGSRSAFRFNEYIERNLVLRHTKPIFFDTAMNIRGEIALSLYSLLDIVMADKIGWERRLTELFDKELHIQGKYSRPAERKRLIERALKELNGKPISTGVLKLRVAKTKDDKDYKLVASKTKFPERKKGKRLTEKQEYLVNEILDVTADEHSRAYYAQLVRELSDQIIWRMIAETKQAAREGALKTSTARYFTFLAQRERGIEPITQGTGDRAPFA